MTFKLLLGLETPIDREQFQQMMNNDEAENQIVASFNCDKSLWERFQTHCQDEGTTIATTLSRWIGDYLDGTVEKKTHQVSNSQVEGLVEQYLIQYLESDRHISWEKNLDRRMGEYLDRHLESRIVRYLESYLGKVSHSPPVEELKEVPPESKSPDECLSRDADADPMETPLPMEDLQKKIDLLKQWVLLTDNEAEIPQTDSSLQQRAEGDSHTERRSLFDTRDRTPTGISSLSDAEPAIAPPAKTPVEVKMPDGSAWRSDWAGNYELMTQADPASIASGHYNTRTSPIDVASTSVTELDAFTLAEKLHGEGYSYSEIAHFLNEQQFTTKRGKQYNKTSVARLLAVRVQG